MKPSGQESISDSDTAGKGGAGSSSMEVITVVPDYAIDADRLPPVNNIRPSSDAQSGPISNVPTTSHMAYLRERYRSQCLSEEATDLTFKSWKTKTN